MKQFLRTTTLTIALATGTINAVEQPEVSQAKTVQVPEGEQELVQTMNTYCEESGLERAYVLLPQGQYHDITKWAFELTYKDFFLLTATIPDLKKFHYLADQEQQIISYHCHPIDFWFRFYPSVSDVNFVLHTTMQRNHQGQKNNISYRITTTDNQPKVTEFGLTQKGLEKFLKNPALVGTAVLQHHRDTLYEQHKQIGLEGSINNKKRESLYTELTTELFYVIDRTRTDTNRTKELEEITDLFAYESLNSLGKTSFGKTLTSIIRTQAE